MVCAVFKEDFVESITTGTVGLSFRVCSYGTVAVHDNDWHTERVTAEVKDEHFLFFSRALDLLVLDVVQNGCTWLNKHILALQTSEIHYFLPAFFHAYIEIGRNRDDGFLNRASVLSIGLLNYFCKHFGTKIMRVTQSFASLKFIHHFTLLIRL